MCDCHQLRKDFLKVLCVTIGIYYTFKGLRSWESTFDKDLANLIYYQNCEAYFHKKWTILVTFPGIYPQNKQIQNKSHNPITTQKVKLIDVLFWIIVDKQTVRTSYDGIIFH